MPEARGKGVRDVVVSRHDEQWTVEAAQELGGALELATATALREITARDDELRLDLLRQLPQRLVQRGRLRPTEVKVGDVENAGRHRRSRLYTRCMAEGDSPEIFDDLYLGLRAGGALRKQRRGEELTVEEEEALGRWQRLSVWRKAVAIGAFAVGTFGLGFTLGGLIFGRWRKA